MATIGTFALGLAFLLSLYGAASAVIGIRRRNSKLVESARSTAFGLAFVVLAANLALLVAILGNDFSVRYVAENSSRATPTFFKVLSLWSADEGSLLLWNLVLAGYVAAVAFRFRRRRPGWFPWSLATMYGVSAFYLALVVGPASPFQRLTPAPSDGAGPMPLLQNHPLMAVHPPALYLGFVGMTVPFALAVGSLLGGGADGSWSSLARRWVLVAWVFLSAGLVLGALWSYGVLGWGGYWAWDPVENVALLPWLAATALLHSFAVERRRGVLQAWGLSLAVGAFALTTFGTFLTRGSVLLSVHAFARSAVGPMYLAFLAVVLLGGFGLIAGRATGLRSSGTLGARLSRGPALVMTNVLLVATVFVVLFGTMFPLALEAATDRHVSVGAPYFDKTAVPPMLLLLFLMGVGPMLPWRGGPLADRLAVPGVAACFVIVTAAVLGVGDPVTLVVFGMAALVVVANARELVAAARSGPGGLTGAWGRQPGAIGGAVVHVGVAVVAVAIAASASLSTSTEVTLRQGAATSFAGYRLTFSGRRVLDEPQRRVVVADVDVGRDGRLVGALVPSINLYPGANEPVGTPSIRVGASADLYASVLSFGPRGQTATFRFYRNVGVLWLWVGGAIVALGGLLALRPRRRRPPAASQEPSGVVREPEVVSA